MTSEAAGDSNARHVRDAGVLDRRRTELDDEAGVWKVFVHNFIENLPLRTEKMRLTLTTGDLAGAMDAVLSLKTSSQMVGAERLAGLAMDLERSLREETVDAEPARVLPRLASAPRRAVVRWHPPTTRILLRCLHSA